MAAPVRAAVLPPDAFSSKAVGTTGAQFLKSPFGARAAAMGGAWAAAAQGAESLFQNPAALARIETGSPSEAAFGYDALLETSYQGSGAYARPFSWGTLAAGMAYASQAPQSAFDAKGDPAGSFTPMDLAAGVGAAGRLGPLLAGGSVKLIRSALSERRAEDVAFDAGVILPDAADAGSGAVDAGLALSNLGPPIKLGPTADPLPLSLRGGFAWRASPAFDAALDAVFPVDDAPYAALGAEALFPASLAGSAKPWVAALRAGYDSSRSTGISGFSGISFGLGLDFSSLRLDYAWVPFGDVGSDHRVTLAFRF